MFFPIVWLNNIGQNEFVTCAKFEVYAFCLLYAIANEKEKAEKTSRWQIIIHGPAHLVGSQPPTEILTESRLNSCQYVYHS